MINVVFKSKEDSVVGKIAGAVAECMREPEVQVESTGDTWHLKFLESEARFDLRAPKKTKSSGFSIDLTLYVNGKPQWHYGSDDISLAGFKHLMNVCYTQGFTRNKRIAYKWPSKTVGIKSDTDLSDYDKSPIRLLGEALGERDVTVTRPVDNKLRVVFRDDMPYFIMNYVQTADTSGCRFILELVKDGSVVWSKNFVYESLTTFRNSVRECAEYGFSLDGRRWKWGTPFEMPETSETIANDRVHFVGEILGDRAAVTVIAGVVAGALHERSINVKSKDENRWRLDVTGKKAHFILADETTSTDKSKTYILTLYDGVSEIWHYIFIASEIDNLRAKVAEFYDIGFPCTNNQRYSWQRDSLETIGTGNDIVHATSRVNFVGEILGDRATVTLIADAVAGSLRESAISVRSKDINRWKFSVDGKKAHFILTDETAGGAENRTYFIFLYEGVSELWRYMFKGSEIDKLIAKVAEFYETGFPFRQNQRYSWQRDRLETPEMQEAHYKDAKVTWAGNAHRIPHSTDDVAKCIASALGEREVTLHVAAEYEFDAKFHGRDEYFNLGYCENNGDSTFSGKISLIIGGMAEWKYVMQDDTMSELFSKFVELRESGFPLDDGTRLLWNKSTATRNTPKSDDEEESTTTISGVVNGDITSIRAVALKYDGKVVAFRLKTNIGSFDINRDVAARYGISDFKTEKFIRLESVNGVLMSESERVNQKFIPDVSNNEADCLKLITALFNS